MPMFLFLSETKTSYDVIYTKPRTYNPSFCFGVDSEGGRGGLLVLAWTPWEVTCVYKSENVVFLKLWKLVVMNGM